MVEAVETRVLIPMEAQFLEKPTSSEIAPRCVDGRPALQSPQGPQMLGGSLHPLVLAAILSQADFDVQAVAGGLDILRTNKFATGVHWGPHRDEKISDCGFGDRLIDIIQTAKDNQNEISEKIKGLASETLSASYELILNYDINKIKLTGEKLIKTALENNAAVETLDEEHEEQAAFVNLKTNTTLDTRGLNNQGKQAFNLDLWAVFPQVQALMENADEATIRDLSLILYMATEMVLVEQKNKPALPVYLIA